jgi:hypothetical protein
VCRASATERQAKNLERGRSSRKSGPGRTLSTRRGPRKAVGGGSAKSLPRRAEENPREGKLRRGSSRSGA